MHETLRDILSEIDDRAYEQKAEILRRKIIGFKSMNAKSSHLEKQLKQLTHERLRK